MANNVESYRATHDAFNRRDWATFRTKCSPAIEYTDHARGLTVKSAAEFEDWLKEWVRAFSDAEVTDAEYVAAGDRVICRFTGRGTNDGPIGPFAGKGHRMATAFCEIVRFGRDGLIVEGELYFDQLSLLTELGHLPPPSLAAAREDPVAIAKRLTDEVFLGGNVDAVDELLAPGFEDHDALPGYEGRAGQKEFARAVIQAFEDRRVDLDEFDLMADGRVVERWVFRARHVGPFLGIPPSGREITARGLEIWRVEGGRITARWGTVDMSELFAP